MNILYCIWLYVIRLCEYFQNYNDGDTIWFFVFGNILWDCMLVSVIVVECASDLSPVTDDVLFSRRALSTSCNYLFRTIPYYIVAAKKGNTRRSNFFLFCDFFALIDYFPLSLLVHVWCMMFDYIWKCNVYECIL